VLGALTDGEHAGRRRSHVVVDDDPALDLDSRRLRQRRLWPDADADHDQIRLQLLAACEAQPRRPPLAEHALGRAFEQHLDPEALERGPQQARRRLVELALHQPVHEVDDGDRAALGGDSVGGLEAE
jgi:hypothetical protein